MVERTPKPRETAEVSFEEWKKRVQPMVELWMVDRATANTVSKDDFYVDPRDVEKGTRPEYDVKIDSYLKLRPEFKDLMDELNDTFTAGVSEAEVKRYSNRYAKIYNRQRELGAKLTEMQKADPEAWKIAMNLISSSKENGARAVGIYVDTGKVFFADSDLEAAITLHLREKKEQKISDEQSSRFYELRQPSLNALDGMKAEGVLASAKKEASKRGFRSRNDMWEHDLEAMRKFRDEVGKDRFLELTSYQGADLREMFGK